MPVRFVSFEDAKTKEEAETFVVIDTGSAVLPVVGQTLKVTGGFQVEVYSLDGDRKAPGGVPVAAHTVLQNNTADAEQYEKIADALTEGHLRERSDFDGAPDEPIGWTPGIPYNGKVEKQ